MTKQELQYQINDLDARVEALERGELPCEGFYQCGEIGTASKHPCPYKETIEGNPHILCNCCNECRKKCVYSTKEVLQK